MRSNAAAVVCSFWVGSASIIAQIPTVSDPYPVNPDGQNWQECSVAALLSNGNEVVVCAHDMAQDAGVYYAFSSNGGPNITAQTPLSDLGYDSFLALDRVSSKIWIGALAPGQVRIGSKSPGAPTFGPRYDATPATDKPWMAIGPQPGGGSPPRHYLAYVRQVIAEEGNLAVRVANSNNPADPMPTWTAVHATPDPTWLPDYQGVGAMPVVLDDGRVVIVLRDVQFPPNGRYNNNLPYVIWSTDGIDWKPDLQPPPLPPVAPVKVANGANITACKIDGDVTQAGDTPWRIDKRNCLPSIAVNRAPTPDHVYVAFYAVATSTSQTAPDRNTNIFISRSVDGGETFPGAPGNPHLLELTDTALGLPGNDMGPDQVMPAVAIDACGGVNLLFYDNRNDTDLTDDTHILDAWYARITNFGPTPHIFQKRLTDPSFTLITGSVFDTSSFLGDYHTMSPAGPTPRPTMYAAYIASDGALGNLLNCYLHKITVVCMSDLNSNGLSDGEDIALFLEARTLERSTADLNSDGSIDEGDTELFWESYDSLAHFDRSLQ